MTWTWDQWLVYIGIPLLILYLVYALWRDKTPWIWHEDQKIFTATEVKTSKLIQSIDAEIKFKKKGGKPC